MSFFIKKDKEEEIIVVTNLNNKYNGFTASIENVFEEKAAKIRKNLNFVSNKVLYFIDFNGDIYPKQVEHLRNEITAILGYAKDNDEVLIRLNSPGGTVIGYGLVAEQLERLQNRKLKVTVVVDEIAASGGYMAAVVSNRIIAAKRSMIGSIGVVANMPNYSEALKKLGIQVKDYTAGEKKRGLTPYSEATEEKEQQLTDDLKLIHIEFKEHISTFRPNVDIESVSTGAVWSGKQALELGLIDEIGISDDVISNYIKNEFVVLKIEHKKPKPKPGFLARQLTSVLTQTIDSSFDTIASKIANKIFASKYNKF